MLKNIPNIYLALLGKLIPLISTLTRSRNHKRHRIESGRFLSKEEIENIQRVEAHTIDHVPSPEHYDEPAPPEEPIEEPIEVRSPEEAKLLAALEAMSGEELLARLSNVLAAQN